MLRNNDQQHSPWLVGWIQTTTQLVGNGQGWVTPRVYYVLNLRRLRRRQAANTSPLTHPFGHTIGTHVCAFVNRWKITTDLPLEFVTKGCRTQYNATPHSRIGAPTRSLFFRKWGLQFGRKKKFLLPKAGTSMAPTGEATALSSLSSANASHVELSYC